jgi:hypothetical protein
MAHFAELDQSGRVIRVVAVNNEVVRDGGGEIEQRGVDFLRSLYGHDRWKQTSFRGAFRGCFAAVGFSYDETADVFVPPESTQAPAG